MPSDPPPPPPAGVPPQPGGPGGPGAWDPPGTVARQLPPASMVARIDVRGLVFGAIALVSAGPALVIAVPILAVVAVVQLLQWQAFRYGFDGSVVRVQQGVLQKRHRSIDIGRIQQVEVDQPLLHRLLGLAVLRLETASEGGETEVELDGVGLAEAERLRAALRTTARAVVDQAGEATPAPAPRRPVLQVPLSHLALSAVTGAQLFALPAALAVLSEALLDVRAEDDLAETVTGLAQGLGVAVLIAGGAILALGAAVVATVLRDGGYTVEGRGDDVVIRRGLLTTRETVLPRHRVQVVEVRQNWLRRALGFATVHVRSAGGGAARDQARQLQVPLVRPGPTLDHLLSVLLPEVPWPTAFRSHPPPARRRSVVRSTLRAAVVAAPLATVAVALAALPGLTAVPWQVPAGLAGLVLALGPVLGLAAYRHLAHALGRQVVSSRYGMLGVTVSHAPLGRLQGVTRTDSPFQRRLGLASVSGHLAGAGLTTTIRVLDVGTEAADHLHGDLTTAAAGGT